MNRVCIIGGGWAGLTAAVYLSQRNIPVTLFEQSKQIGGRSRCIPFGNVRVDYGQHVLFGSYRYTRSIFKILDIHETDLFRTETFKIESHQKNYISSVAFNGLFSPLNMLGILYAKGIFLRDKISILNLLSKIAVNKLILSEDVILYDFLRAQKQGPALIDEFWGPLCSLALNCNIRLASAKIFINFLRQTLTGRAQYSRFFLPLETLSEVFCNRAIEFIEKKGGNISYNAKIDKFNFKDGKVHSVDIDQQTFEASHFILATPFQASKLLMDDHQELHALRSKLENLKTQKLYTLYLQFSDTQFLSSAICHLAANHEYWIVDYGFTRKVNIIAVKIVDDPDNPVDPDQIIDTCIKDIQSGFPKMPTPIASLLVEDDIGMQCAANIGLYRPGCETNVQNLFLAGDYINSALPANLESSVMSAILSAQKINNLLNSDIQ